MSKTSLSWCSKNTLGVLGILFFTLFVHVESQAAIQLGPIVGKALLGKRLDVQTSLSGLPSDVSSQMRSYCLRASVSPVGVQGFELETKKQELRVEYAPTVNGTGSFRFKSDSPLNDPVMEVSLSSQCPLISFQKKWTLLLEGVAVPVSPVAPEAVKVATVDNNPMSEFDISGSSLLQASRVPPQQVAANEHSQLLAKQELKESRSDTRQQLAQQQAAIAPADEAVPSKPVVAPESEAQAEQNLSLASAKESIEQLQLIESPRRPKTMDLVDPENALNPAGNVLVPSGLDVPLSLYFVACAALLFLVGGGGYWFLHRPKSVSGFSAPRPNMTPVFERHWSGDATDLQDNEENEVLAFQADTSSSRNLFQSFIGVPGEESDVGPTLVDDRPRFDGKNTSVELLASTIGMLNRVEPLAWVLPESYSNIVSLRNQSIQARLVPDSLVLKLSLGLIELSFQHAVLSQLLSEGAVSSFVSGLGADELSLEDNSAVIDTVPDILQAYVQAKLCELDGPEKRAFFIRNMNALTEFCQPMALCFKSTAWSEFMFELGTPTNG